MEGPRSPPSRKRKRAASQKTYKDKRKGGESYDVAKQRYGDATAVFLRLLRVRTEKRDQFSAQCQTSVKESLSDLYRSRREEADVWLKFTDRKLVRSCAIRLRNAIAESWANHIGEKLQDTIEKLYVDDSTRDLDDNEVS
jgi:hypothetical protein